MFDRIDGAGITYHEHLLRKARAFWGTGFPLPLDLFAQMNDEGMDVDALETQFKSTEE